MLPMSRMSLNRRLSALFFLTVVTAAIALTGCGGKSGDADAGALLAVVGEREIHVADYEFSLAKLEEGELPRDEDGMLLDTAEMPGKQEFLTTLINKDLIVQKAEQLGYDSDQRTQYARESLTAYEAGLAMWASVVGVEVNQISNEEFDLMYEKMGEARVCSYVITNFYKDAEAARDLARSGADWEDVSDRYHEGSVPPSGKLEVTIPYGRYSADFERPIFETPVGGISEPIHSDYGWWIVRVNSLKEIKRPSIEDSRAGILDIMRNRKVAATQAALREEVHAYYKLEIDDEALYKAYMGLPLKEALIDETTGQPVPKEQLLPLDIEPADLDMPFYSYEVEGEVRAYTLGDYKIHFDRMNTFQRPKKEAMMGGMRSSLIQELERAIMPLESKRRGFYEDPEVVAKVNHKVEEIMVTNLYNEIVTYDERVTPEQMDAYWAEHARDFDEPAKRSGFLVIAADKAQAEAARAELAGGAKWKDVVAKYGTDETNKQNSGKLADVDSRMTGPVREALYSQEVGVLGAPFAVGDGRWGVVRLDKVVPAQPKQLLDITETVGQTMKMERKEAAFQALLAQWAEEFGVTRYDENLAEVRSWKELTNVEMPGPPVERD